MSRCDYNRGDPALGKHRRSTRTRTPVLKSWLWRRVFMIIDGHNHILTAGLYPGYERFIKEMTLGYFQSKGDLPVDRDPIEADWTGLEYLWEPIDPDALIRDHPGVDKCTILAVAPS